ncbi:hypothetical protein DFJ58DRAFT_820326, partial [Suillus subalutaceus]|uniref:uncharacterized protein n=1 Tax=Suillus subalutaceus TaxID=48586 RepID=UPI001B87182B
VSQLCAQLPIFLPVQSTPASSNSQIKLPHFIAYVLHRTKLHASVTFAALILLQGFRARFIKILRSSVTRSCAMCALV